MTRKTLMLIICLSLTLLVLFVIAFSNTAQKPVIKQPKKFKPTPTPAAQTIISLSPNIIDLTLNNTSDVAITMDTGGNEITAVQIVIGFDPTLLHVVSVKPTGIMQESTEMLKDINAKNGRLSYALGLTPTQIPIISSGDIIAIVTFARNQTFPGTGIQKSEVSLLQRSLASARGIGPSVIKNLYGATVLLPSSASTNQQL